MTINQLSGATWPLLLVASLTLAACGAPGAESATAQGGTGTTVAPAPAFVFDVPALIGKNIDQVEQALGKADAMPQPTEEEQNRVGFEWKKKFTRQGYQLLVKYYRPNKDVYAFTLLEKPGSHTREGTRRLEAIAHVDPGATAYYIQLEPEPGQRVESAADANTPPKLPRFVGITILLAPTTPPVPPK